MRRLVVIVALVLLLLGGAGVVRANPDVWIEWLRVSSAYPGQYAVAEAAVAPDVWCEICVKYLTQERYGGCATALGLREGQYSDWGGYISWEWFVGTNTTPGRWRVIVSCTDGYDWVSETGYIWVRSRPR